MIHSRGLETRKDGVCHVLKGTNGGLNKNIIVYDGHHRQFAEEMGTLTGRENRQGTNWAVLMFNLQNAVRTGEWGDDIRSDGLSYPLTAHSDRDYGVAIRKVGNIFPSGHEAGDVLPNLRIRRLTPIECERLQGFPDGWTRYGKLRDGKVVEVSDTQRYKLLGNAVTVNVVEFLGRRILEALE